MKIIHITFLVATLVVAQLNAEEPSEEAVGFYRTGYQLLKAQNYRNAAIELERAVGADADYGAAHFALGLAYNYLNEYGKSIAALERAMVLGIQLEKIPSQWRRRTPRVAQVFCSADNTGTLRDLFTRYGDQAPGYELALAQTTEAIELCTALRQRLTD